MTELDTQAPATDTLAPESGNAGGSTGNWFDSLPEDLRGNPNITKYKSLEDFGKGHLNAVSKLGEKGVIIPKDDAPKEDIERFYNTIGRPEKPEGYKLESVGNLHPEVKVTPEFEGSFRKMMHEIGVPNKQANSIYKTYLSQISNAMNMRDAQMKEQMEKAHNELLNEWGKDFDTNKLMAKRVVEKFGGKETLEAFGELGNNPKVLKFLAKVGKKFSEDSFSTVGGVDLTADASSAKSKIKAIMADKSHPYWNDGPGHHEAVEEVTRLYRIANEE